jgi:hypothetical protein
VEATSKLVVEPGKGPAAEKPPVGLIERLNRALVREPVKE